jgi:hypothetical protein
MPSSEVLALRNTLAQTIARLQEIVGEETVLAILDHERHLVEFAHQPPKAEARHLELMERAQSGEPTGGDWAIDAAIAERG